MSVRVAVLLLGCALLTGCAHNPATGRTDFVMMSEQQELALGHSYNQQILKENPRYADEKLQAYVQRVGERVARYGHRSHLSYSFTVVDSAEINASAIPGGHICGEVMCLAQIGGVGRKPEDTGLTRTRPGNIFRV